MKLAPLFLALLILAPFVVAQTTTNVQRYAADFEDVRANHTIRSNGSVPYQIGNASHYFVGNITNQSLSVNRTWTLPDLTGTVALADSAGNIQWAAVSKSGSSLADLGTRSAGDLTSGTLSDDRLSANIPRKDQAAAIGGAWAFDTNPTFNNNGIAWVYVNKAGSSLADLATRAISDTTGTLGPTRGGTGLTTYATGDLLYASAADTLSKLPAGTNGHVLTLSGGVPTWQAGGGTDCTTDCTFTGTVAANRLVATHDSSGASGYFPVLQANTSITGGTLSATTGAFSGLVSANGGLTVAATQSFKLPVQSAATMPTVGQGVCAYDSTNHRVQCGVGSSPAYKTLACLECANTFTTTQTVSGSALVINTPSGVIGGEFKIDGIAGGVVMKSYSNQADFIMQRAGGTQASPSLVGANQKIGGYEFYGHDGSSYRYAATFGAYTDGTPASGSMPGKLMFYTTPSGSTTPTERMVIDNSGDLHFNGHHKTITDNTGGTVDTTCDNMDVLTSAVVENCFANILKALNDYQLIN